MLGGRFSCPSLARLVPKRERGASAGSQTVGPMPPTTAIAEGAGGVLAVIRRKLPADPTLTKTLKLVQPPAGHERRPLHAAYVVPTVLMGLLDCVTDNADDVDAAAHLEALGVRPVWRVIPATTNGAARTLVSRLRSASNPVCLVVLFGPVPVRPAAGVSAAVDVAAAPHEAVAADAAGAAGEAGEGGEGGEEVAGDGSIAKPAAAASSAPIPVRRRRLSSAGGPLVPSDEAFIPLSRPCVLHGGVGGGATPSSPGGSTAVSRPTTRVTRTFAGDDDEEQYGGSAEFAADKSAAAVAARATARIVSGSAPPLRSTHDLPTAGNWVRLSVEQQYELRRRAETERRRAAEEVSRGQVTTFTSEPRLSASRRWPHQGAQTSSGRGLGAAGPLGAAAAPNRPGSFLPLKVGASVLVKRLGVRGGGAGAREPFHPLALPEGNEQED